MFWHTMCKRFRGGVNIFFLRFFLGGAEISRLQNKFSIIRIVYANYFDQIISSVVLYTNK